MQIYDLNYFPPPPHTKKKKKKINTYEMFCKIFSKFINLMEFFKYSEEK